MTRALSTLVSNDLSSAGASAPIFVHGCGACAMDNYDGVVWGQRMRRRGKLANGIGATASGIKDRIGHALTPQTLPIPDLILGPVRYCPGDAQSITTWPRGAWRQSPRCYSVLMVTVIIFGAVSNAHFCT